jgi:hypothetical protein
LRNSAGALLASHPVFSTLARYGESGAQPSPVKSLSEYRAEAAQFEAAIRDLGSVPTMPTATDADLDRITSVVETAGKNFDLIESWLVMVCFSDPGLNAWVRKEIRDEASAVKFLDDVRRNPRVVDTIPAMTSLLARLDQLKAEKAAIVWKVIAQEKKIAGTESSAATATKQAEDAAKCQKIWGIIKAVVLIVVAVVVAVIAVVGSAFGTSIAGLALTFAGTGTEAMLDRLRATNASYLAAVATITASITLRSPLPATLAKAVAARQAAWLSEKVVFLT